MTATKLLLIACILPLPGIAQREMVTTAFLPEGPAGYKTVYDPYSDTLTKWWSWHMLTGKKREVSSEEAHRVFPSRLQRYESNSFPIKDKYYPKLASLRDIAVVYDVTKRKAFFLLPDEGFKFKKGENADAITAVLKEENKAEQKFIFKPSALNDKFYFIRNGGLSAIAPKPDATVEDIIKPIGGLRITDFVLSPGGKYAVLQMIPATIKWTKWSMAYNEQVYKVFDLSTGKPFVNIKIDDFYTYLFSYDDKYFLNWSWITGVHSGTLYNLEKNEKIREYGPAIVQRTKSWWQLTTDGQYLYASPAAGKNPIAFARVFDLMDSLRPVKQFRVTSPGSNYSSYPPLQQPKVAPSNNLLSYFPDLPSSFGIDGFTNPPPGSLLPSSVWARLSFYMNTTNSYNHFYPSANDSIEGKFKVYAIGTIAKNNNEQMLLVATQLMKSRSALYSDNENSIYTSYYVCIYDQSQTKVTRVYWVLEDGQNRLDPFEPPVVGTGSINIMNDGILVSGSRNSFTFDKQTFKTK